MTPIQLTDHDNLYAAELRWEPQDAYPTVTVHQLDADTAVAHLELSPEDLVDALRQLEMEAIRRHQRRQKVQNIIQANQRRTPTRKDTP
jgi:hypothetical protein